MKGHKLILICLLIQWGQEAYNPTDILLGEAVEKWLFLPTGRTLHSLGHSHKSHPEDSLCEQGFCCFLKETIFIVARLLRQNDCAVSAHAMPDIG